MNELTKQSGILLLLGEDWSLCCEAAGTPEPTGCPVCERPWDAQLSNQGKDVVVLNSRTRSYAFMLCMDIAMGGTMPENRDVAAASCVHRPSCLSLNSAHAGQALGTWLMPMYVCSWTE